MKGLATFRDWFSGFRDQYVLIGGTAADIAMRDAGFAFRATKDLDVVLQVEALTPAFAEAFWAFVDAGGYVTRQAGDAARPRFYRFHKPSDDAFPAMIELFARAPDALRPIAPGAFTPIPFEEAAASLSAILLDDQYYRFIMDGRRDADGLTCVGVDRLIALKAVACLDLGDRKSRGEAIDAKQVRKHLNDVLRLSQLLTPQTRIEVAGRIADDLQRFIAIARAETTLDAKSLGLGLVGIATVLDRLAAAYVRYGE